MIKRQPSGAACAPDTASEDAGRGESYDTSCMPAKDSVSLGEVAASALGRVGVVWTLEDSSELNANLVHFEEGDGIEEHVNDEVDVIVLGIAGSGLVEVDGEARSVSNGTITFVPKGARRSILSTSGDFAYLSVHRRRGPLRIGR